MKMRDRIIAFDQRSPKGRNLLLGLWMRSAMVGALVAAAGFATLIDPPRGMQYLTALTLIVAGGAVAWYSWRRTLALCNRIDEGAPIPFDRNRLSPAHAAARAPG